MTKIGVTGHQERDGIRWDWVAGQLRVSITRFDRVTAAYSSLAVGSDQLFARIALELGIPVIAVIPLSTYERFFVGTSLGDYRSLLKQCHAISLNFDGRPEEAFLNAGKYVCDQCDVLYAIWDGMPAEGVGGTEQVVSYARQQRRSVVHLNPMTEQIIELK